MSAKITKILKMQVGTYTSATGKEVKELREIGVVIEHTSGENTWQELKLNADLLQPVLYQLAKPFMQKGSASIRVNLYDLPRSKSVAPDAPPEPGAEGWDGDDGRFENN